MLMRGKSVPISECGASWSPPLGAASLWVPEAFPQRTCVPARVQTEPERRLSPAHHFTANILPSVALARCEARSAPFAVGSCDAAARFKRQPVNRTNLKRSSRQRTIN